MSSHRIAQINSLIQREVAAILSRAMNERKFGLLTVTGVETARDLDSAKVYVSCLKNGHQFDEEAHRCVHTIQAEINSRLVLRKVPKLILKIDPTSAFTAELDELVGAEEATSTDTSTDESK